MDIGKLQASLTTATQETTLALANANFDFSLIRYEAPAEYKELGQALTKTRKSTAEIGPIHITARRLGSLFQSIVPSTPTLISAYGQRASEIAQSPAVNPKGTSEHGPFKDYIGVDGASIWAAATSGPPAIAMHLLACMIAACWQADEATAIWMELVTERKRQLETKAAESDFYINEAIASKLTIEQDQLANWDASARAWLAAAENAPFVAKRQKNIRSVLKDTNAFVQSRQDLYTSVTEAWILALTTMENVLRGSSYSVQDGAVILALAAWHLYPDLIILGSQTKELEQQDDLVNAGGVVTIGLTMDYEERFGSDGVEESLKTPGVHWSLSLAHLRYYGTQTATLRSLTPTPSGNNRFTIDEFIFIYLGAAIAAWNDVEPVTISAALDIIRLIIQKIHDTFPNGEHERTLIDRSWPGIIARVLDIYYNQQCEAVPAASKFLQLGFRHHRLLSFSRNAPNPTLADSRSAPHYQITWRLFGLYNLQLIDAMVEDEDKKSWIMSSLTNFCKKRRPRRGQTGYGPGYLLQHKSSPNQIVFYTAQSLKRTKSTKKMTYTIKDMQPDGGYPILCPVDALRESEGDLFWYKPPKGISSILDEFDVDRWVEAPDGGFIEASETSHIPIETRIFRFYETVVTNELKVWSTGTGIGGWRPFRCGPSASGAEALLKTIKFEKERFLDFLVQKPFFNSLSCIATASDIYSQLPGSTISPEVLSPASLGAFLASTTLPPYPPGPREPFNTRFARFWNRSYDRGMIFRLLALLETGHDPGQSGVSGREIMAISHENTLFIDAALLSSPRKRVGRPLDRYDINIRRVCGNVGQPGLTLIGWFAAGRRLVCRRPDLAKWNVINHRPFDGKPEDTFSGTSMQLQFTGYSWPIDFGGHNKINDGRAAEAAVSAFDSGRWLCDIDISSMLVSRYLEHVSREPKCPGDASILTSRPPIEVVIVENWEELLSPHPSQPLVVQCLGNWQARMAAVAISITKLYNTILLDHSCWYCAFRALKRIQERRRVPVVALKSDADSDESSDEDEFESESEEESVTSNSLQMKLSPPAGTSDDTLEKSEPAESKEKAEIQSLSSTQSIVSSTESTNNAQRIAPSDKGSSSESDESGSSTSSDSETGYEEYHGRYIPVVFIL